MKLRTLQLAAMFVLAACGSSARTNSTSLSSAGEPANLPSSAKAFTTSAIATFDNPWAMAFLPQSMTAIVTEKPGRIWLVDVESGRKQPVIGAPQVKYGGQGGLLDVVLAPAFASDNQVYLTYSQPSLLGGSSLALARAKLVRDASGARLEGLQVLWRDPAGGEGGQFGAIIAFAPDGRSLFLSSGERQRMTPAQDPNQPIGKILHLTLDGKPAPGNPWAGKTGASSVTVTDPPDDTEAARTTSGWQVKWPGENLTPSEIWTPRSPQSLRARVRRRTGGCGQPRWDRVAGTSSTSFSLAGITAGRWFRRARIMMGLRSRHIRPVRTSWPRSFTGSPQSLRPACLSIPASCSRNGKATASSARSQLKSLIHVHIRGDTATKVEQWDMGHRIRFVGQGPDGAVYLLEDEAGGRMLRLTPARAKG